MTTNASIDFMRKPEARGASAGRMPHPEAGAGAGGGDALIRSDGDGAGGALFDDLFDSARRPG